MTGTTKDTGLLRKDLLTMNLHIMLGEETAGCFSDV